MSYVLAKEVKINKIEDFCLIPILSGNTIIFPIIPRNENTAIFAGYETAKMNLMDWDEVGRIYTINEKIKRAPVEFHPITKKELDKFRTGYFLEKSGYTLERP